MTKTNYRKVKHQEYTNFSLFGRKISIESNFFVLHIVLLIVLGVITFISVLSNGVKETFLYSQTNNYHKDKTKNKFSTTGNFERKQIYYASGKPKYGNIEEEDWTIKNFYMHHGKLITKKDNNGALFSAYQRLSNYYQSSKFSSIYALAMVNSKNLWFLTESEEGYEWYPSPFSSGSVPVDPNNPYGRQRPGNIIFKAISGRTPNSGYHDYKGDPVLYNWFKKNYDIQQSSGKERIWRGRFSREGIDLSKLPPLKGLVPHNFDSSTYFYQTGIATAAKITVQNWQFENYYTYVVNPSSYDNSQMYFINNITAPTLPDKAPNTEKPVIRDDQEIVEIEFDSAKIEETGAVDNQYILGHDYWDEKVGQYGGVFNVSLRKEWINGLKVKHSFFDKANNKFREETDENKKIQQLKTLFGAYGVDMNRPNPEPGHPEQMLNNFLLWSNGVSEKRFHAWDDRRRTLHVPNYLIGEKVNNIMDRALTELMWVKNKRPVVPELKKGKKYKLSFHRPVVKDTDHCDSSWESPEGCYFFVTSGWEQDENNKPYFSNLPNIFDFVKTSVENWGRVKDSDVQHWGAQAKFHKYIQNTSAGNLPLLQIFMGSFGRNELNTLWQFNLNDFVKATGNINQSDPDFKKDTFYNARLIYTQKELNDMELSWENILKFAWLTEDGKQLPNWELVCGFDVNLQRSYSKEMDKDWRRSFPWSINKVNQIDFVPSTENKIKDLKTDKTVINWTGHEFDVDFSKVTVPDFKLVNCLFNDKGQIAVTFSEQGLNDLWSFLINTDQKGNWSYLIKPFHNINVTKMSFSYRVTEDWQLEITKINAITYENKVPDKEYVPWWKKIINWFGNIFGWLNWLPNFLKGILALTIIGTLLYYTSPIYRPLFTLLGTVMKFIERFFSLVLGFLLPKRKDN